MKKNYAVWKVIAETAKHRNEVDGLGNKFTSSKTENFSLEICLDEILKKNLELLPIKNPFEQYQQEVASSDSIKVDVNHVGVCEDCMKSCHYHNKK